ncbi:MAG: glycine cleavage system protein GcvH [Lentisphaerae bacterium]|nr:glycine cleavage system protein GcvH [Lentisphaerota bacterium]
MTRYTVEHEWVRIEGTIATVGISVHAQNELGDITFVEMPAIGTPLKKGDALGVIESVKAASEIFAPVGGTVASINEALNDTPEAVNDDAEGAGWICTLEGVDASDLNDLMTAEEYAKFCN